LSRNIKTIDFVDVKELGISNSELRNHAEQYGSVHIKYLKRIFQFIKPDQNSVLLDCGCGKGRVLFVAVECGVKHCRGVELSNKLCVIAKNNVKRFKCRRSNFQLEIIETNAMDYKLRDDENIIFFFNPFDEYIMEKVMKNIKISLETNSRAITIVYISPKCHNLLLEYGFTKIYTIDLIGSTCNIYAQ